MPAPDGPLKRFFKRSITLRIRVGAVAVITLLAAPALIFFGWLAYALLLLVVSAIVALGCYLRDSEEPIRHSFEAAGALLSSLAILAAGYWYFIERPRVPKLALAPEIHAWPVGKDMALVRVSLGLENVGSTEIVLSNADPIKIEIGQVLPASGRQYQGLVAELDVGRAHPDKPLKALRTDKWPLRAKVIDGTDIVIEAEETERLHYKAVVPCKPGLLLAVTAKVPKRLHWFDQLFTERKHENLYWVGQALTDEPITNCNEETADE